MGSVAATGAGDAAGAAGAAGFAAEAAGVDRVDRVGALPNNAFSQPNMSCGPLPLLLGGLSAWADDTERGAASIVRHAGCAAPYSTTCTPFQNATRPLMWAAASMGSG